MNAVSSADTIWAIIQTFSEAGEMIGISQILKSVLFILVLVSDKSIQKIRSKIKIQILVAKLDSAWEMYSNE